MIDLIVHPHHRFTGSFAPLLPALGEPVRVLYGDPDTLREYLPTLRHNPPKLLILWQLEHLSWWASGFCPVVIFPMYDHTMHTPDDWLVKMGDVRWICLSRTMHQRLAGLGLDSRYFPYAPDPAGFPEVSWERGARAYFWERRPEELDAKAVAGLVSSLGVDSLEVRSLADLFFARPTASGAMEGERLWQPREEYLRILGEYNVFVAPRRFEGIGMAFLEAMAMGMCVVAENQPTAHEYIVSGENGVLFSAENGCLFPPRRATLSDLIRMGKAARASIAGIHQQWQDNKVKICRCVEEVAAKVPPGKSRPDIWQEAVLEFEASPHKLGSLVEAVAEKPNIWRSEYQQKKARLVDSRHRKSFLNRFIRYPRKTLRSLIAKRPV